MERDYKRTAWKLRDAKHSSSLAAATSFETAPSGRAWSSTTFNAYFDLVPHSRTNFLTRCSRKLDRISERTQFCVLVKWSSFVAEQSRMFNVVEGRVHVVVRDHVYRKLFSLHLHSPMAVLLPFG